MFLRSELTGASHGGGWGEPRSAATPYTDKLFLDELGKIRTHTLQFAFIFIKQLNNY